MRELALFAGAGGGILGGHLLGWRTVCAVELDAYARGVLIARQNDGTLAPFPVWDDVRTFDGRPWRGVVDVVSGGFPCQDISLAGSGAGVERGAKSGLWREMARIVREVRPRYVLVENVPALTRRGLGVVLGDLAAMGYDASWGVVGARHAGAPHRRDRMWIVAHAADADSDELRHDQQRHETERRDVPNRWHTLACDDGKNGDVADANGLWQLQSQRSKCQQRRWSGHGGQQSDWWQSEPNVGRVANGVAARVDRLRCLGNGQVPAVACVAWSILHGS